VLSDQTEFSSVIGDIYDAAIDHTLWQRALGSICAYVGGYSAVLFWHDAAAQHAQALYLFNDDPAYTRLYFEKYLPMDPFFPASSFIDVGVVRGSNDIVPQAELERTRFYKEWIKPQGIADAIAVNLEKGVTRSSFLVVRTDATQGPADDLMFSRAAALVPHLQRAVAIGRLFDQARNTERALTDTLGHVEAGVFLVGADGSISFANDPAQKMLADATLVRREGDALHAAIPEADRILREVFAAARRGDASIGVRGVPSRRCRAPRSMVRPCPAADIGSPATNRSRPRGGCCGLYSQYTTERAAAVGGDCEATWSVAQRNPGSRCPDQGSGRQASGRPARAFAGNGKNASPQNIPQDRNQAAERTHKTGCGYLIALPRPCRFPVRATAHRSHRPSPAAASAIARRPGTSIMPESALG
jgi:hypothetical protein